MTIGWLDLFHCQVKFGLLCFYMEKTVRKSFNGRNLQQMTTVTKGLCLYKNSDPKGLSAPASGLYICIYICKICYFPLLHWWGEKINLGCSFFFGVWSFRTFTIFMYWTCLNSKAGESEIFNERLKTILIVSMLLLSSFWLMNERYRSLIT